jgi:hypothetical protein
MSPRANPGGTHHAAIADVSSDFGDVTPFALIGALVVLVARVLVAAFSGSAG